MNHLSQAELVLYQSKIGLSLSQKKKVAEHLQLCRLCHEKLNELQSATTKISKENVKACQEFQQNLESYLDGKLEPQQALMMEFHHNECDRCQQLYQLVADVPDWETAATPTVPIPVSAQEKIERAVLQALKLDSLRQRARKASEKIVSAIDGLVARFILDFRPISPAMVFRGDQPDEMKVIEHPGGNLHLATGLKNVTLELTSIFEEFKLTGKTDDNGEIVFEKLAKGEYIASVAGYRLTEVKICEPAS